MVGALVVLGCLAVEHVERVRRGDARMGGEILERPVLERHLLGRPVLVGSGLDGDGLERPALGIARGPARRVNPASDQPKHKPWVPSESSPGPLGG